MSQTIGRLMLDISGHALDAEDARLLAHPSVGGLILFSRNFSSLQQLQALIAEVRQINPACLICVDHEGGRVQRFKQPFTHIPAMAELGQHYAVAPEQALQRAQDWGWLMAAELRAVDIDFSFAPVLDRDYGVSAVIGNRAFAQQPEVIEALAGAFMQGMHEAGMAATGKHFPGHGAVAEDSHVAIPIDHRPLEEIEREDMSIFHTLIGQGLDAMMPAHVIYAEADAQPAGFSPFWLQDALRGRCAFDGVIFSDDLSMEGATCAGSFAQRAEAALEAGCDMVLVCNHREGALEVLEYLSAREGMPDARVQQRLQTMQGRRPAPATSLAALQSTERAQRIIAEIATLRSACQKV